MTDDRSLPDGWIVKPLGDAARLIRDKVEPSTVPDAYYIGLEHVEAHTMKLLGFGRGSDVRSAKTKFSAGEVLYGKLRPYLNKVTQPPFDGISSTDFLVFTESDDLDSGYLAQFLNQLSVAEYAHHVSAGVELPRVDWKSLSALPVAFPPTKSEQRQIVEQINQARSLASSANERLAAARRALDRFRQAVLAAACAGRLTADWREANATASGREIVDQVAEHRRNHLGRRYRDELPVVTDDMPEIPDSWAWASPGSLCEPGRVITYGVIKLGAPVEDGVPTLRSSDVRWLHLNGSNVKRISRAIADDYRRTYLQGGELLVTVRGTLGGVAVAPQNMAGWNVSREVAVIPLTSHVNAQFCALWIASSCGQRWLGAVAKGVTYTGVNIEDIRKLPLPVPPLDEQHVIVEQALRMLSAADRIADTIAKAERRAQQVSQAVLAKAFRGELLVNGQPDGDSEP